MSNRNRSNINFTSPLTLIIGLVAVFLLFFIISRIVKFLWWLALIAMPVLLIATFIIDRTIIFNYVKRIRNLYKTNRNTAIVSTILSVIGLPFVILFLFGQAMLVRKANKMKQSFEQEQKGEYVDFEELESRQLDLNEPPKEKRYSEDEEPPIKLW